MRSSQVFELNNRRRLNKIDLQVINRRSKYFSDLKATTHFLPCKWYLLYQQDFFFLNLKNRLTCNYEITDTYYFLFIPQDTIMIVKVHSFKKKKNSYISKGIIWLLNSINFSEIVLTFTIQGLLGGGQFSSVLDRYLEIIIRSSPRFKRTKHPVGLEQQQQNHT